MITHKTSGCPSQRTENNFSNFVKTEHHVTTNNRNAKFPTRCPPVPHQTSGPLLTASEYQNISMTSLYPHPPPDPHVKEGEKNKANYTQDLILPISKKQKQQLRICQDRTPRRHQQTQCHIPYHCSSPHL